MLLNPTNCSSKSSGLNTFKFTGVVIERLYCRIKTLCFIFFIILHSLHYGRIQRMIRAVRESIVLADFPSLSRWWCHNPSSTTLTPLRVKILVKHINDNNSHSAVTRISFYFNELTITK